MKYKKKYIVVGAYKMKDNTINYSFYYMNECFLNTFATTYSLNEAKEIVKQLYKNVKKVNKLKKNRKRYTYFIVKAHTSKTKLSNGKYLYINRDILDEFNSYCIKCEIK